MKYNCPKCNSELSLHELQPKIIRIDEKIIAVDIYCYHCHDWTAIVGMVI